MLSWCVHFAFDFPRVATFKDNTGTCEVSQYSACGGDDIVDADIVGESEFAREWAVA